MNDDDDEEAGGPRAPVVFVGLCMLCACWCCGVYACLPVGVLRLQTLCLASTRRHGIARLCVSMHVIA